MSQPSLHTVVPEGIIMADDGTLSFYFSEALDGVDQLALQAFAMDFVNLESSDTEVNVDIIVDMPAMIKDMLEISYGFLQSDGTFLVDGDKRTAFESVKKQLQDSLALLDKIVYE